MPNQTAIHTIVLQDHTITYQLKKSWRSRYLRITIHPQKGLLVSSPKLVSHGQIEKFLYQKASWITSKLNFLKQQQKNNFQFGHSELVTILGNDYRINITDPGTILPKVQLSQKVEPYHLEVQTPLKNLKTAEQHFFKWIKRFTEKTIKDRVHFYSQKHQLQFNKIYIKNQQSLWGSCSTQKNLNFSKRLIQAPLWLIDYVVCHELAHLTHMNHSQKFWNQVAEYFPEYRKARRHLKAWKPNVTLS